ncbi:MAG: TolC family protein [Mediterranea sp.]|jgi:outer membrane protein|nr:TolC family protein [Mediterranea sp.]
MNIKPIHAAIAGLLLVSPAAAQNEGWTLQQCVAHAIENNLTIQRAENQAEQSKVEVNTAKWARLPNLNGSANQNYSWGRAASPIDNSYTNTNNSTSNFSLSTNVPLFTGLELPNRYSLSKLNLKAAIEDLNKAKNDIAINVASAYVQVLFNRELAQVANEQAALSKEQLNRITRLAEVGKSSQAEIAEAKARVAQDETSAVQAANNYNIALLELSQLLELPTSEGFSLASPDEEPDFGKLTPPDAVFVQALTARPEILAAQYRLEGSEKNIRIAQSGYYPTISFSAGLGSNFYTTKGRAGDNFLTQLDNHLNKYLGFSLNMPVFNRFATRNRVRNAKLQKQSYSIQLDETRKSLYKEIQQAWYNAVAAEAKYNSGVVAVAAGEEFFRLVGEKFENGKATSIEYNEAKLSLMKALSDKIQAKYDYMFRSKVLDFYKGKPIQ